MDDTAYMREALKEAVRAAEQGEVPIGAVLVLDGEIVARAHNMKETWGDPTAHAEMVALHQALSHLHYRRLEEATIYVTVEPCPMCAGALVMARLRRLVYGAPDPKAGAVGSIVDIARHPRLNHRLEVKAGVLAEEAAQLLRAFFQQLRNPTAER